MVGNVLVDWVVLIFRVPFFCFFFVAMILIPLVMSHTESDLLFSLFPVIFFGLFFFMAGFIVWKSFKT